MSAESAFIRTQSDFDVCSGRVSRLISGNRLPHPVFRPKYYGYLFESFDWAMNPHFWNTLRELAYATNDSSIQISVLDPDPVTYFHHQFGYYNWLQLPIHASVHDYADSLFFEPPGSPADAIRFNSEVVVWLPPSEHWVIYGEHSPEVCVLATDAQSAPLITQLPSIQSWLSANQALDLISLPFRNKVPAEFRSALLANYRPLL